MTFLIAAVFGAIVTLAGCVKDNDDSSTVTVPIASQSPSAPTVTIPMTVTAPVYATPVSAFGSSTPNVTEP